MFGTTEGHAMSITAVTGPPHSHELLAGGSGLLEVALLAARAAAGARRVESRGPDLDDVDRDALERMRRLLESTAETVEFFETSGQRGARPSASLASSVDVTIHAAMPSIAPAQDSEHLVTFLHSMTNKLGQFLDTPTPQLANEVAAFSAALAQAVSRQTGHTGELTGQL